MPTFQCVQESLKAAEVVVVPYNTLLSKPARKAVGLSLKSSLVIIDEAHNIPETLRSLSSCQLTLPIIEGASAQLNAYVKRYNSRLAGRNIFYLGKICKILKSLSKYLKSNKSSTSRRSKVPPSSEMVTSTELLFTLKLDNINLFNVMRYLERSRLSQKLHGFSNAIQDDGIVGRKEDNFDDPNFVSKHISCMSIIESFLKCLTGAEREGRVVVERPNLDAIRGGNEMRRLTPKKPSFRYLLLDPSIHFKDVIDEAHAIVLAGGTLRPFPHVATELCRDDSNLVEKAMTSETNSKLNSSGRSHLFVSRSLTTFSCGHVVPSRNVFVSCLSNGPSNVGMDFRHSSRSIEKVCDELGKSILSISCLVPAGFVIFFPSYTYEAHVVQEWKRSGLYNKIHHKKKVYREPKSAGDVEKTLGMYSKSATSSGAILLCVINGKMSEGINFADDMARCVLVVGLPYPDITDPELKEKMQLLDKESREKKISISGQAYYQNLCMRAVNQSIGRAIRHINDHAAIILADARYVSDSRIWNKLPSWLCGEERPQRLPFEENMSALKSFFNNVSVKD
jgi:chromosome transmission fidelity protein 1